MHSPNTQGYDRSHKFALYRRLASLQEYVLVDPDTRRAESFRRIADDQWVLYVMSEGDTLDAASLSISVPTAEVLAFDWGDRTPASRWILLLG